MMVAENSAGSSAERNTADERLFLSDPSVETIQPLLKYDVSGIKSVTDIESEVSYYLNSVLTPLYIMLDPASRSVKHIFKFDPENLDHREKLDSILKAIFSSTVDLIFADLFQTDAASNQPKDLIISTQLEVFEWFVTTKIPEIITIVNSKKIDEKQFNFSPEDFKARFRMKKFAIDRDLAEFEIHDIDQRLSDLQRSVSSTFWKELTKQTLGNTGKDEEGKNRILAKLTKEDLTLAVERTLDHIINSIHYPLLVKVEGMAKNDQPSFNPEETMAQVFSTVLQTFQQIAQSEDWPEQFSPHTQFQLYLEQHLPATFPENLGWRLLQHRVMPPYLLKLFQYAYPREEDMNVERAEQLYCLMTISSAYEALSQKERAFRSTYDITMVPDLLNNHISTVGLREILLQAVDFSDQVQSLLSLLKQELEVMNFNRNTQLASEFGQLQKMAQTLFVIVDKVETALTERAVKMNFGKQDKPISFPTISPEIRQYYASAA